MDPTERPEQASRADFRLADWLVQPSLNRLSHGDATAQIEPKLMDVLRFLAHNAGEVVSKNQITDAVWTDQFITDSVVTRAIAELRRALADDAHNPSFIETISKRGYRLIAPVQFAEPLEQRIAAQGGAAPEPASAPDGAPVAGAPYVAGQWVRGASFYGRESQIREVLEGQRNWLWLLGNRRMGKTSFLKQLEHLTAGAPERGFFPIFWDLQGAEEPEDLHRDFSEALLDAGERLGRCGIAVDDVAGGDLFASLGRLRRRLRAQGLKLLLLCDEVEELIHLNQKDPSILRKLRRAMQSREGIRSVLASSIRLWALAGQKEDTSPFLHGFTPPLYLDNLRDGEARDLIRQTHLAPGRRPRLDDDAVERIRSRCGNHPYLIQLVCRRQAELGDLDEVFDEVAADSMVSFFFAVDFEQLTAAERTVLRVLSDEQAADGKTLEQRSVLETRTLRGSLQRLENLGFVGRDDERRHRLVNGFFRRWLQEIPLTRPIASAPVPPQRNEL